uniref:hypothetical protein n=1 Tax=Gordonia sp. (in: high G+C Gram-positive bacteria) TaxID=84139 RepID=UPI0026184F14
MTAHVRRRRAATTTPSLRSIVAAAGAVLTPLDPGGPRAVPDIAVRGIEVYQPGVPTDYSGHLVVVGHPVHDRPSLIEVSESCAGAAALILPSTTPAGLGGPPAPFRLRRARWIGGDALLRAPAALTHRSETAATDPGAEPRRRQR